jgi:hypothetical protein
MHDYFTSVGTKMVISKVRTVDMSSILVEKILHDFIFIVAVK